MQPVHPGAILREDILKEKGISVADAAAMLQTTPEQLSGVLDEITPVGSHLARRLESVFDVPVSFWFDLQEKYDAMITKPIDSKAAYDATMQRIDILMQQGEGNLSNEEKKELRALALSAQAYEQRKASLEFLAKQAQDLNLGY